MFKLKNILFRENARGVQPALYPVRGMFGRRGGGVLSWSWLVGDGDPSHDLGPESRGTLPKGTDEVKTLPSCNLRLQAVNTEHGKHSEANENAATVYPLV